MGQKQSYILGLLGLAPFIIIFLMYFISPPNDEIYNLMIFIYIAYAAIISSFLGGIQWGLITAFADKIFYVFTPLLITVIPALISWAALLSLENLKLSLVLLLIGYVISLTWLLSLSTAKDYATLVHYNESHTFINSINADNYTNNFYIT